MPIPSLNANGHLPAGIHPCNLSEIRSTFGQFTRSDRRCTLFKGLSQYVDELSRIEAAKAIIVNGSFVTGKEEPGDVDILVILKDDFDLSEDLPPYKRNLLNKHYIPAHYEMDFFFGYDGDLSSTEISNLFGKVKGSPGVSKGFLRIDL